MSKSVISSDKAPAAIGTYSQAVFAGDTLYLSGQLGLDPATMTLPAEFAAQCERVFANLKSVVEAAGASLDQVVKLTGVTSLSGAAWDAASHTLTL